MPHHRSRRRRPLRFVGQLVVVIRSSKLVVVHHPTRGDWRWRTARSLRLVLLFFLSFIFAIRNFLARSTPSFAFLFTLLCLDVRLGVPCHLPKVRVSFRRYRRIQHKALPRPSVCPINVSIHTKRRLMPLNPANVTPMNRRPLWASELVMFLHVPSFGTVAHTPSPLNRSSVPARVSLLSRVVPTRARRVVTHCRPSAHRGTPRSKTQNYSRDTALRARARGTQTRRDATRRDDEFLES